MATPSLLLIPDRYKAAKLYSQIPDSGAGDLTFARNSNATRVNSAGLIEKVRTNFALYSEQFDNAAWFLSGITISANALTNPLNGASTADFLVEDTSTGTHDISPMSAMDTTTGISYTFSVYAKADTRTKILIGLGGASFNTGGNGTASFDLSSGSVISTAGGAIASITLVSGGWYRCVITKQAGATGAFGVPYLQLLDASGNASYTGNGSKAAAFGWQFEISDFGATPYIPTTTAAVSVGMTANIPRLDYTGGGCPNLLLEPQRTNLALFSEQLNNASWDLSGLTVTANNTTSPDGNVNAERFSETAIDGTHLFYNLSLLSASSTSTVSVFYKKGTRRHFAIKLLIGINSHTQVFDADTATATSSSSNGLTNVRTSIVSYGNGWVRASVTGTDPLASTSVFCIFSLSNAATPTFDPVNFNPTYLGSTSENGFFYGAQLEAGSYPTSYIPTLGSSVTRLADAASKTGISSLIGQQEGVLYLDIDLKNTPIDNSYILLRDVGVNDYLGLRIQAGNLRFEVVDNGVLQAAINYVTNAPQIAKVAMAYKLNDFVMYVNGTQVGTDTSATVPTCDIFDLNFNAPTNNAFSIKTAALYPVRLSNSQLQSLTAL